MFAMKALTIVLGLLGTLVGLVVGVLAHAQAASGAGTGWTLYEYSSLGIPRRYVDYLPVHDSAFGHGPSWFPGLAEYGLIGLGAGIVIAVGLGAIGLRITRVTTS
jgi:hypothetical protein